MATPPRAPRTVVNPYLAHVRQLARTIAETRPQPEASLPKLEATGNPRAGLEQLYRHAEMMGDEGPSGYLIHNFVSGPGDEPSKARIARTSLDDSLAGIYGDDYSAVRDAAMSAKPPGAVRFHAGSRDENFTRPVYVVNRNSGASKSFVDYLAGLININPLTGFGGSRQYILGHEAGHLASPYFGPRRGFPLLKNADQLKASLTADYGATLAKHPKILEALANRIQYLSRPEETAAIGNQLRRLEYQVSGNKMITPEDRIRAVKEWARGPAVDPGRPALKVETMFPGDPMIQYGPAAGQPAEGYMRLKQQMRQILPRMDKKQAEEFLDILGSGASTSQPEPGYV